MKAASRLVFISLILGSAGFVNPTEKSKAVEKARLTYGCSALREAVAIATRLNGNPALYTCYRGRERAHQKLSYVEFTADTHREFRSLDSFAARFGPFTNAQGATALALAFTQSEPDLQLAQAELFDQLAPRANAPAVKASGIGHRVIVYEYTPQQGQCEVPGYFEIVVQTWPDGMKREIKRLKIYERKDKRKICVD